MILDSALSAKSVLEQCGEVGNGLRNAVLCDGATLNFEYKSSLEKTCAKVLGKFNEYDKFISQLNASDLGDIFVPINQRAQKRQELADGWDALQREFLQNVLKDAKREAILQKGYDLQQVMFNNLNNGFQNKYSEYLSLIDKYNHIIAEYNTAATVANNFYQKAAQHQERAKNWKHSADINVYYSKLISQQIAETPVTTHAMGFTVGAGSQNGLTITQSHTIHKGNNVIAHSASSYNSCINYGQKIDATMAMAQARKNAIEVPMACQQLFSDLIGFVDGNNQYLQGFEVPEFTLTNPYSENRLIFSDGVGNGVVGYSNFGSNVIDNTLSSNLEEIVQQFYSTPTLASTSNGFKVEPDNSFWNIAVENLNQDWPPLTQKINQDSSLLNSVERNINNGVLAALTFITGSGAAEASPLVASGAFAAPSAAPAISGYGSTNPPPMTLNRLGTELLDVAQKTLLMTNVLINPAIPRELMHQILVTPMHEINPNDSLLPGSCRDDINTSIPPYKARDCDSYDNNTGHSSSGPDIDATSVPPYNAYDGDPIHFMYKEDNYVNKYWSIKGRIKAAKLPTEGRIRFVPPEKYRSTAPLERGPNNGYYDKFKNEWVKGPSRTPGEAFEWDVQLSELGRYHLGWASRDGEHINVSLNGELTHR